MCDVWREGNMGREDEEVKVGPKIIAISDTHNLHSYIQIPECDILIHAGDATGRGSMEEIMPFLNWLSKQPAKYKVFIPGNHDWGFEKNPDFYRHECQERGITLLIDEIVDLEGLKIYGSPITPFFCNWAFNRFPGPEIQKHWDLIPKGIDILVTHGPPRGFLDQTVFGEQCGSEELLYKILENRPKVHIFGHMHDCHGLKTFDGIKFYNVTICDERYKAVHKPTEIDL